MNELKSTIMLEYMLKKYVGELEYHYQDISRKQGWTEFVSATYKRLKDFQDSTADLEKELQTTPRVWRDLKNKAQEVWELYECKKLAMQFQYGKQLPSKWTTICMDTAIDEIFQKYAYRHPRKLKRARALFFSIVVRLKHILREQAFQEEIRTQAKNAEEDLHTNTLRNYGAGNESIGLELLLADENFTL